jgi:hypothetical protein
MGDIWSGHLSCKEARSKTSGRTSFREVCLFGVLFSFLCLLCVCVCVQITALQILIWREALKKHIHSHEKIAVDAATAAWRNAGQNRHGARVERPQTPEEGIQGGCICTRTEGELRRNALGRGLVMKDKCDLVLIHAC